MHRTIRRIAPARKRIVGASGFKFARNRSMLRHEHDSENHTEIFRFRVARDGLLRVDQRKSMGRHLTTHQRGTFNPCPAPNGTLEVAWTIIPNFANFATNT